MNSWHVVHVHLRLQYALAQIVKRRLRGWCALDDEVWDHAFALEGDDAPMDDLRFYWMHMQMYRHQVEATTNPRYFTAAAASTRGTPEDQAYCMKLKSEEGAVHGGGEFNLVLGKRASWCRRRRKQAAVTLIEACVTV